jgi:hypothetical protein
LRKATIAAVCNLEPIRNEKVTTVTVTVVKIRFSEREREFVTSNDKPRIVTYRYSIEASIDVS